MIIMITLVLCVRWLLDMQRCPSGWTPAHGEESGLVSLWELPGLSQLRRNHVHLEEEERRFRGEINPNFGMRPAFVAACPKFCFSRRV